jgi:hypothetical protein
MPTNKNAFCEVKSGKSWQEVSIDDALKRRPGGSSFSAISVTPVKVKQRPNPTRPDFQIKSILWVKPPAPTTYR